MIKQFLFTRTIDGHHFSVMVPCKNWDDANDFAKKTGMKVDGSDVHTIPCIPIFQFMMFCSSLVEGNLKWKPHAEEQIEAFLTAGWPEEPNEQDTK